jgi:hypothetical protein
VAVGAAGLLRGHAVQYSIDQLPDAVLPQIAGLGHRDQGRRIHQETPHWPFARFRAAAPGRKSSEEAVGCSRQGRRGRPGGFPGGGGRLRDA